MLDGIPRDISICFAAGDSCPDVRLVAEEEIICRSWRSEAQKNLFQLGRFAAHEALRKLGFNEQVPILRSTEGAPVWPDGIVGSISNTSGAAAAAVARRTDYLSIGIDIESENRTIRPDTARFICTENELEAHARGDLPLLRLFCAKECVYKAVAPLFHRFIGFKDVELSWKHGDASWSVKPLLKDLPHLPWETLRIFSFPHSGLIVSILWIPQSPL